MYGYKSVGDPQCLWTFNMKDSVLALDTEVEAGRVSTLYLSLEKSFSSMVVEVKEADSLL